MTRTIVTLAALLAAPAAHAAITPCFEGTDGRPLQGMRVQYPTWWGTTELETDSRGCVSVPTTWSSATVTIHATNRVVQVVEAGVAVVDTRRVAGGVTYTLSDDHTLAENLRLDYENGLRDYGPFTNTSPVGGTLTNGPYLSADLSAFTVLSLPYVEPAPIGGIPPRLHLDSDVDGETPNHELAHALFFSQVSDALKVEAELYYIGWLTTPDNTHDWDVPSTPVVAFIEAWGGVGNAFEIAGTGDETAFLAVADSLGAEFRTSQVGDDTIEGVVFGVLFDAFADRVGLDYVVDTTISCDVLTLQDYAWCIHDTEGRTSDIFGALRQAADEYGVDLAASPKPWDWDYCSPGYPCGEAEGDCDTDADCDGERVCFHDVGWFYGQSSGLDVCELPSGHGDKCTPDHPCRDYEGDCDTASDCVGASSCVQNVGAAYGMASWVDVCEPPAVFVISN